MIEIKNLDFSYNKNDNIFENLNITFVPGNIYGLLGKNGAGKTTLLQIIAGLLFPRQGQCCVFTVEVQKRLPECMSDIYFLSEEIYAPPLTLKEYRKLYAPFYPNFDTMALRGYLDEFCLAEDDQLSELSHGQKKKFFIAFGLASNTRLLIFDEPTNGLDIPGKSQFRKVLVSAIDDNRLFIISTHQVRDIQNLIDPILILDEGKIIFHQPMEEVNKKMSVHLISNEPEEGSFLFYEKVIGGYALLVEDNTRYGNVDLELLFNAVINSRERIDSLLNPSRINDEKL